MTDEEVTYTTVRFHKSSGLQDPVRPEETQRPREADHREYSVPWKLIVIVLGILCSLLLVTVAVLVTHILVFQHGQEKHDQEKTLDNATKSDRSSVEEMLRNKSSECNACKDNRPPLNREQNICYREAKIVLNCSQLPGKRAEGHWFCSGMKCYYFITDNNQWKECVKICKACTLSLLKIDDEDELKFLKPQLQGDRYWIGLKHNKSKQEWQWIGDGPSKLDLAGMKSVGYGEKCAFLTSFRIQDDDCTRTYGCLCEKRLRKLPIPLSCVKERTQPALHNDEMKSEKMF